MGDPHSHADHDNDRFSLAGEYILERRPTAVVCAGDFGDMSSLSSYDKGKLSFEGRAYQRDVAAVIDAQEKLFAPIRKHNRKCGKRDIYEPDWWMVLGNHDGARINREVQDNPGLRGKLSIDDLKYAEYGWKVVPFLQPAIIDTVAYSHYWAGGISGRPIGGENVARQMLNKLHASAVTGHNHLYDHAERAIVNGIKIFALSVGCFTHPDMIEDWNVATVNLWWRGLVELIDLDGHGYYDEIRTITLRKLMRDYA